VAGIAVGGSGGTGLEEGRSGWGEVVAGVGVVGETRSLVGRILLVSGDVVSMAKSGCWERSLAYGAEGAVACGGAMVTSTVGAGEFGGVAR
jgi:hypothetical protein